MWSRLDTERKHWSLAAGDQRLPGRRSSHGGRKTYLQPPLLRERQPQQGRDRAEDRGDQRGREREREEGWHRRRSWGGKIDEGNEKGKEELGKKVETVGEEGMKTEGK